MCYRKENVIYSLKLGILIKHHRRPRSRGGNNNSQNVSYVPCKLHEAYHLLFSNYCIQDIAKILNRHWVDSDYELVVKSKV